MRLHPVLFCLLAGCLYVREDSLLEAIDRDGDGWFDLGAFEGEAGLPAADGIAQAIAGGDCNDDPDAGGAFYYPGAPDLRGDGCNTDCFAEPDSDGDDWPDSSDCDAADPEIFPCSPFEVADDGVDSDCDGLDSPRTDSCNSDDPDPMVWDPAAEAFARDTTANATLREAGLVCGAAE
jgi:hypothetical protein